MVSTRRRYKHNLGYWDDGQWWAQVGRAHGYWRDTLVKHPNTQILAGATLPVAGFSSWAPTLHTEDVLLRVQAAPGTARPARAAERDVPRRCWPTDLTGLPRRPTGPHRRGAGAVVRTLLG